MERKYLRKVCGVWFFLHFGPGTPRKNIDTRAAARSFVRMSLNSLYQTLSRRRPIKEASETSLSRILTTLDLTLLGIGSSLGVGVYVLAGAIAKDTAGPAVVLSFAIAALASVIAGLNYAEFGARVPRAGSAYVYSYVTMGEAMAFLIGWTLVLEYVIGSASVVRGLSTYVDALFNNSMRKAFEDAMPMNVPHLSPYPDFFAFTVSLAFAMALAFGAKESSVANDALTLVNLAVVIFVVVAGAFKADLENWNLRPNCTAEDCSKGHGGFMPFGISGVITGAATCFYGFIGFDCVATTGEEAKDPQRSIPVAIIVSLSIVFLAYFGVSTILTTVLPYYDQYPDAPFPHMFHVMGWDWARFVVTIGAICGLCSSLLGAMFPLPRIIYAMASDGLIFKCMGIISDKFHTPFIGTVVAGLLTGILSAVFELKQLVNMMSIGTLLAYSIVAACVLVLRYDESKSSEVSDELDTISTFSILKQLVNYDKLKISTRFTSVLVSSLVFIYITLCFCLAWILSNRFKVVGSGSPYFVVLLITLLAMLILILIFINLQPKCDEKLNFAVPLVPLIPGLSIVINIYLMMMLDTMTWVRFGVWMIVGLCIYGAYGVWNSNLRTQEM